MATRRFSLLFAALLLLALPWRAVASIPKSAGYVTDEAGLLSSDQIAALNRELADYERKTSNQIVVLTVKSLDGQDIESYSIAVAEAWKPGQKGKDNGAILLIAANERQARIEVGYGLEGVLTDARSSQIIRNVLVPRFRSGDEYGGIAAAVSAMESTIGGEFTADAKERPPAQALFPILVMLLFVAGLIGLIHWTAGAAAGGLLAGGLQTLTGFAGSGWIHVVLLGLIVGAVAPFFIRIFFGSFGGHGGGMWSGRSGFGGMGGFGGFSGGGFGGGFSGGGGGFGGGGASGSW